MTNRDEHDAGTDPSRRLSVLRLQTALTAAGQPLLHFAHAASRRYVLEFTGDLQNWDRLTNSPTYLLGLGQAQWLDESPIAGRRFYRLRAE